MIFIYSLFLKIKFLILIFINYSPYTFFFELIIVYIANYHNKSLVLVTFEYVVFNLLKVFELFFSIS